VEKTVLLPPVGLCVNTLGRAVYGTWVFLSHFRI